ncbi:TPA: hypothetical protein ACX6NP_000261 [Photobacterium damselae]
MDTYYDLFGKELVEGYKPLIINALNDSEGVKYTFVNNVSSLQSLNSTYMSELIYRAHFGGASSLVRNLEWVKGMAMAYEHGMLLPFASSFRSLIESTGDSSQTLSAVAKTLADNHKIISDCIAEKENNLYSISELEDLLIHYSHGRRLQKGEEAPETHKAKSAAFYVNNLKEQTGKDFYECYSELCQLTHPAADSVLHLMLQKEDNNYEFSVGDGKTKIEELMSKYDHLITDLLMFAFNPGLLILKTLNHFPVSDCHSASLVHADFSWLPLWVKCEQSLSRT